jgi:ribosomal protein L12E/L44/L45/RPP1/RPP2
MEETLCPRSDALAAGPAVASANAPVSWPAIIAGAFVAIGASLILLSLGSGLGFASISPWADHGVSATTFAVTTAIWLIVTQWISASLGGYIAGRLRTRWHGTHTHEVFFRDTAHGLVTWAVATVVVAALAGGSLHAMMAGGTHALSAVASAGGQVGVASPGPAMAPQGANESVETEANAKVVVDAARKAAAEASLYTALALLIGAFIASVSAALGGRLRDEHP